MPLPLGKIPIVLHGWYKSGPITYHGGLSYWKSDILLLFQCHGALVFFALEIGLNFLCVCDPHLIVFIFFLSFFFFIFFGSGKLQWECMEFVHVSFSITWNSTSIHDLNKLNNSTGHYNCGAFSYGNIILNSSCTNLCHCKSNVWESCTVGKMESSALTSASAFLALLLYYLICIFNIPSLATTINGIITVQVK